MRGLDSSGSGDLMDGDWAPMRGLDHPDCDVGVGDLVGLDVPELKLLEDLAGSLGASASGVSG